MDHCPFSGGARMATVDVLPRGPLEVGPKTAYLVLDTESVPDGRLLSRVKYREENLAPEEAVVRAQAEARERSPHGSDFLPVSYQYPVAMCVVRVAADFGIQAI